MLKNYFESIFASYYLLILFLTINFIIFIYITISYQFNICIISIYIIIWISSNKQKFNLFKMNINYKNLTISSKRNQQSNKKLS